MFCQQHRAPAPHQTHHLPSTEPRSHAPPPGRAQPGCSAMTSRLQLGPPDRLESPSPESAVRALCHPARSPGFGTRLTTSSKFATLWIQHLEFEGLNLALVEGTQASPAYQLELLAKDQLEQLAKCQQAVLRTRKKASREEEACEQAQCERTRAQAASSDSEEEEASEEEKEMGDRVPVPWADWNDDSDVAWRAWANAQDNKVAALSYEVGKLAEAVRQNQLSIRESNSWTRELESVSRGDCDSLTSQLSDLAKALASLASRVQGLEIQMGQVLRLSSQGRLAQPPGLELPPRTPGGPELESPPRITPAPLPAAPPPFWCHDD